MENGYVRINEAPGIGVDLNEEEAKKFPIPDQQLGGIEVLREVAGLKSISTAVPVTAQLVFTPAS